MATSMDTCEASNAPVRRLLRSNSSIDNTTLIVMSAPSVANKYYQTAFQQIVDFMVNFANIIEGKDEAVILVDKDTLKYFKGKVPDHVLIKARIDDIWIRDFAPVLPKEQIKFQYRPDYQRRSDVSRIEYTFETWLFENDLQYKKKSNIVLDGGNFVDSPDGDRAIMTDRVFKDNPRLNTANAKARLKEILGISQLAIIPAVPDETTGHADGMLMWVSDNKIFVPQFSEPLRSHIIRELEMSFPKVQIEEIPNYYKNSTGNNFSTARNIYVNSVVTDHYIYMPTFNEPHDAAMAELMQSHTSKRVVPVPAEKVCFLGGSVRCLTWQVKGELKRKILPLGERNELQNNSEIHHSK